MKFEFKLERLLKIRIYRKQELENQLAVLQNELFREKDKLKQLYLLLQETYSTQTKLLSGRLEIKEIIAFKNYIEKISKDIEIQKKVIIQLNDEFENKKKQLIKALQKVKVLEKLKEKKFEQYKKEIEYIESHLLDEIGTIQFIRNRQFNQL